MSFSRFMKLNGYKYIILRLITRGDYSARDSEWNYSDIPHLNYVHTKVDAHTYFANNERVVNLFMQKFGPFSVPVSTYIEHLSSKEHTYVMNIIGMMVSVTTKHKNEGKLKALTITEYKFFYRSFLEKMICFLFKLATRKNYKVLMSEDVPMRNQKGFLRKNGITFLNDNKAKIGFVETEDLSKVNVDARNYFKKKKNLIADLNEVNKLTSLKDFFITIVNSENKLSLLADICQHEGANLKYDCNLKNKCMSSCPWHGKIISPLLVLDKLDPNVYKFEYLNQMFSAQILNNKLLISVI